MGTSKGIYSLPFKKNRKIKICDAPYHLKYKSLKNCIDFYMPEGTLVLAAREGIVSNVIDKYSKTFNNPKHAARVNEIVILHKDGGESVYLHLKHNSAKVKKGDKVKRGDIIALSGKTGYATYPHLHFGVYKGKSNLKVKLKNLNSIGFKSHKFFESLNK